MPRDPSIKKVLVLGSGPIIIGQAAEFDYAGAQACLSLKEEGIEVVLLNSNPATIMTDDTTADRIYIEPMTIAVIERILDRERPDGILPTLGGQTGLNLGKAIAEAGLLEKYHTCLLGTPLETIRKAEDREAFRNLMLKIGEPIPPSDIAHSVSQSVLIAERITYPVIIRPAYTLGGSGGGIANTRTECETLATRGLEASPIQQILVEKYIGGWKEIEYEVMRDKNDNCITVCNMENFDPVGIHTGDSIVVAPSQTLSNRDYQMLRTSSVRIIRALGVEGGCNIQFGLDPKSSKYFIIEVNPRVSRSSALASKATGYPIARVAAKIAVGMTLDEIANSITKKTVAAFEPALDYVVVKIPRFPFDKFPEANRILGTQMKATGEVMAIGRTFEEALKKAIRSLDTVPELDRFTDGKDYWAAPTDLRLFLLLHALRGGVSTSKMHEKTQIDPWFLDKLGRLVRFETTLAAAGNKAYTPLLKEAKQLGFSDAEISRLTGASVDQIKKQREKLGIIPTYKMVDTCAGEFEAQTPYFYSTWESENEAIVDPKKAKGRAIVIGSGPIRIGQGIEFDYCCVHAAMTIRKMGYEAVMVNNNPETVSTDFDVSDRLYFEPLTEEDVSQIHLNEGGPRFITQFGGQTSLNLASSMAQAGIMPHEGMVDSIERASDRRKFEQMLQKLGIPYPRGNAVLTESEAIATAGEIGYPVLVRPSFVLGGRAMEIMYLQQELEAFIGYVFKVSPEAPVLIDRYISGREVEIDLIYDGHAVLIPGIMEHIERAGIHSGDSMAVYPTQNLTQEQKDTLVDYATRMVKELGNIGLNNIQFVMDGDAPHVIELNPRSSRTVPYLSKITSIPMVELATRIMYGATLKGLGYTPGLVPEPGLIAVKAPVFSFAKLESVNTKMGPEMKSTGEVLGIDVSYPLALYKAFLAAGISVPLDGGTLLATIADQDKTESIPILRGFQQLGFSVLATEGTTAFLRAEGIRCERVGKISEQQSNDIPTLLRTKAVQLVINTPSPHQSSLHDAPLIRETAFQFAVPCLGSLDTARALLSALREQQRKRGYSVKTMKEYKARTD